MKLLAPLCALLVLGCAPDLSPAAAGTEFTVPLGQSRTAEGIDVGFDAVSDSRCKPDVQCVWEGDAVVTVSLTGGEAGQKTAELHSNTRFPHTVDHSGHRVELLSVDEPADEITLRVLPAA